MLGSVHLERRCPISSGRSRLSCATREAASGCRWLKPSKSGVINSTRYVLVSISIPSTKTVRREPFDVIADRPLGRLPYHDARGTESLQTLRWREADSNHRSPMKKNPLVETVTPRPPWFG